jgi:exonuclease I
LNEEIRQWRTEGKHLPPFMRDFHDQKDLFKTIHERYVERPDGANWVQAHCYTIDFFLWFMAQHGYTLQKCRTKLPFDDIHATIAAACEVRMNQEAALLNSIFQPKG